MASHLFFLLLSVLSVLICMTLKASTTSYRTPPCSPEDKVGLSSALFSRLSFVFLANGLIVRALRLILKLSSSSASQFEWQLKDYTRVSDIVFSGRVERVDDGAVDCTIKSVIKGEWSETYITLSRDSAPVNTYSRHHSTPTSFRPPDGCFSGDLSDLKERDSRVFFARVSTKSPVAAAATLVAHVHVSKIALTTLRTWMLLLGESENSFA